MSKTDAELQHLEERVNSYKRALDSLKNKPDFISFQIADAPAGVDGKVLVRTNCILGLEPTTDNPLLSVVRVSYQPGAYIVKGSFKATQKRLEQAFSVNEDPTSHPSDTEENKSSILTDA